MDLHDLRENYDKAFIDFEETPNEPMAFFRKWFLAAHDDDQILEANAVSLSTVCSNGLPETRVVLLKAFSEEGFVFYSNYESRKGKSLACNPHACLSFFWPSMQRQVIINGSVAKTNREQTENYFHSRPRTSQIAARMSQQSGELDVRFDIEKELKAYEDKLNGEEVPCPKNWGGYVLTPTRIEFWQGRPSRMHDRLVYTLNNASWGKARLWP